MRVKEPRDAETDQKVACRISASLNNTANSCQYQTLIIPENFQINNRDKDGGLSELAVFQICEIPGKH